MPAAFEALLDLCGSLRFEPHNIAAQVDARGRYDVSLDTEFPLLIKLFHYTSQRHTRGPTWHERLELFLPLDGPARFQMGPREVRLARGDILVVDNLKLHHVVDFAGFDTRVIVISFLPEFVYSLGSPSHDYSFLLPFYSKVGRTPHVVRASHRDAAAVQWALAGLLARYFGKGRFREPGCKAALVELLWHLTRHFGGSEVARLEFLRQQERSLQLKKLFDHIQQHPAEHLSVAAAAKLAGMSQPQFMKTFKKAASLTLVAYLSHVRLALGARMLRESTRSIAEIAAECGFADQSYFDRRFKRAFGQSPSEFRRG